MTVFPISAETLGAPEPIGNCFADMLGKAAGALTAGQVVSFDGTGAAKAAAAGDAGPFGVAGHDRASGDAMADIFGTGSYMWVKANGTIVPNTRVVADANGTVKQIAAETFEKIVGVYKHKPGEGDVNHLPSNCATGNTILVQMTGGAT